MSVGTVSPDEIDDGEEDRDGGRDTRKREKEEEEDEDEERTGKQTPAVSRIVFLSFSIFAPSSSAFIPSFPSSLFLLILSFGSSQSLVVEGNP